MTSRRRKGIAAAALLAALATLLDPAASASIEGVDGPPLAPAPTQALAGITQRLGERVPATLPFVDSDGHPVRLGEALGGPPVVLVLGYYRCPRLCSLVAQGLLEALSAGGRPAPASRLLFVSIDPAETPADASARLNLYLDYARFLHAGDTAAPPPWLRLFTGTPASIRALAQSIGYAWRPSAATGVRQPGGTPFAHPAAAVILTPEGRISHYLMGVSYDPAELRDAIDAASSEGIGARTLKLALQCAHLDAPPGSRDAAVLGAVRASVVAMAVLAFIVGGRFLERRRARPGAARDEVRR